MHRLRNDRKAERQKEAIIRQKEYDKLTTQQKLTQQWDAGYKETKQVKKLIAKLAKEIFSE